MFYLYSSFPNISKDATRAETQIFLLDDASMLLFFTCTLTVRVNMCHAWPPTLAVCPSGRQSCSGDHQGARLSGCPPLHQEFHQEFHQSLYPTPSGEQPIVWVITARSWKIYQPVVLFHCCMSLTNLVNTIFTSSRIRLCIAIISNDIEHLWSGHQ